LRRALGNRAGGVLPAVFFFFLMIHMSTGSKRKSRDEKPLPQAMLKAGNRLASITKMLTKRALYTNGEENAIMVSVPS